ncbi:MAG: sigma-70 family RNA polymerase sigma factor [Clostridia bacterium]|nr:sigma-70 family RNA polymerase sigma factor [Clostridia bacterium]
MSEAAYDRFAERVLAAQAGDSQALDELVRENLALVKYIVRRFLGHGKEYDDLYQMGCMGLVKAIQKFDTTMNVRFSTYAVPMIMGEIRRFLRDDNTIHISRSIHEAAAKINAFARDYELEHERAPGVETICAELHIDREMALLAMSASLPPRSLSEPVGDRENVSLADTIPVDGMAGADDRLLLRDMMRQLTEQEVALIRGRYFERRTQQDVGKQLGFTQVQVSRMESRILRKLRAYCDENSS